MPTPFTHLATWRSLSRDSARKRAAVRTRAALGNLALALAYPLLLLATGLQERI